MSGFLFGVIWAFCSGLLFSLRGSVFCSLSVSLSVSSLIHSYRCLCLLSCSSSFCLSLSVSLLTNSYQYLSFSSIHLSIRPSIYRHLSMFTLSPLSLKQLRMYSYLFEYRYRFAFPFIYRFTAHGCQYI